MRANKDLTKLPALGRLGPLDAARGFAALYVFVYHMIVLPAPPLEVPKWVATFLKNGGNGVSLFFVVSGFTMCLTMAGRQNEPRSTARFYIRRVFRIVPLFYSWIAATCVRDWLMFDKGHGAAEILLNLSFGYHLVPGMQEGIVMASWTLAIEMLFYLIFPWVFRRADSLPRAIAFFFLATVGHVFSQSVIGQLKLSAAAAESLSRFDFFGFVPSFALGMVAYWLHERLVRVGVREWGLPIFAAGMASYAALLTGRIGLFFEWRDWQAVIYGVMLLGLLLAPSRLLVNRFTSFLGTISYSLYLNHPALVLLLIPVYRRVYIARAPLTLRFGFCLVLTTAILTAVSFLTYQSIERPGIRLGGLVDRWLRGRQDSAAENFRRAA
jgi:peptidoglycan/LPS O-acetylase OafA/YrhL